MKKSAGILVFRRKGKEAEFLLAHPGGPYYKNKDENSWSIPKGEFDGSEDAFEAAKREFKEETGKKIEGNFIELKPVRQNGGKFIHIWAIEKNMDIKNFRSNVFEIEWPPRSGKYQEFPEIDKLEWFKYEDARKKILKGQIPVLEQLLSVLE